MTKPSRTKPSLCVGVDVGGTFTDVVVSDGSNVWRAKALSTPDDVGRGVIDACMAVAQQLGLSASAMLARVERFGLGTTAVTNALAAHTGLRTGLITTRGFEDILPLSRGQLVREDGWLAPPAQIVPRERIVGVAGRIDRDGAETEPLDVDEVLGAAAHLIEVEGVEALAVSFLWGFRNPAHEDLVLSAIEAAYPGIPCISGARLYPVIREYERTMLAVLNAYVAGAFTGIDALTGRLQELGCKASLLLVHSGGGSITVPEARRFPIGLAESGPAAGVAGALAVATTSNVGDLVTCDMGGTSFDVSVISGWSPTRQTRGDLMGYWTPLSRVDIESIGAGGGSIGWVDARGMLRVGPHSAGAVPGPACYGRGGEAPTVTDALVVLGYIDPSGFLGGGMALDSELATRSCDLLGRLLGLDPEETAWGIRQIALEGMARAVRSRLVNRGLDPRQYALISYGGCGGLFTADIARLIGSPTVLVPALASVLSAFGAATSDIRRERVCSLAVPLSVGPAPIRGAAEDLATQVEDDLASDGIAAADRSVVVEADLRFTNQVAELAIRLPSPSVDAAMLDRVQSEFFTEYGKRYGSGSLMRSVPTEVVTLRAIGTGRTTTARLPQRRLSTNRTAATSGSRSVRVARGAGGLEKVDLYVVDDLGPGSSISGPALIDAHDTTIWVPAGMTARVDRWSTFVLEVTR